MEKFAIVSDFTTPTKYFYFHYIGYDKRIIFASLRGDDYLEAFCVGRDGGKCELNGHIFENYLSGSLYEILDKYGYSKYSHNAEKQHNFDEIINYNIKKRNIKLAKIKYD